MNNYHIFYFTTTILAILAVFSYYMKTRNLFSFGIIFPFFYIIYSFTAPLALILPSYITEISQSYLVWEKMYYIHDSPYIYQAHFYYFSFLVLWFFGFIISRKTKPKYIYFKKSNIINHKPILIFSILLGMMFTYLIFSKYGASLISGVSIYAAKATRETEYQLTTIDKGIFSLWSSSLVTHLAVFIHQKASKIKPVIKLFFLLNWLLYLVMGFAIGDRSQLFIGLIGGLFVYATMSDKKISLSSLLKIKYVIIIIAIVLSNTLIKSFRGISPEELAQTLLESSAFDFNNIIGSIFLSVESFAPYSALPIMINEDIDITWGASFANLIISFVPRFLADLINLRDLGSGSYKVYAATAGFLGSKQGFAMHYVSDWYLNFWIFGIFLGGFLTGFLMGIVEKKSKTKNLFWLIAFSLLAGAIPAHLRGGIEGVRAIFYEYWSIPFLFLIFIPYLKNKMRAS